MSNEKPLFIVDAMLGNIAKKLRLLGFDSFYSSNIDDDELLRVAIDENRILITKDEPLTKKATKQQIKTIQITKNDEIEQFMQINQNTKLGKCIVSGRNSRCPVCNGKLVLVEKKYISKIVPKGVLQNMNEFWRCEECEKIYWEGTHIKNLQKFTSELNDRLL